MGTTKSCCKTCSWPNAIDTATGRRQILDKKGYYMKNHQSYSESSNVKITTEYVEKPDGQLLFTKLFEPKDPEKSKGMILYSVGFGDHTEWFCHDVGATYAEYGFIVFMIDHKGHGRSDGTFAIIDDFEKDLVDENIWIFNYAMDKYIKSNKIYSKSIDKYKNYFLSGGSMGGAVSILIALKQQNKKNNPYKGIILMSPMVAISERNLPPQWQVWCLRNCLLPCCPYAKLISNNLGNTMTADKELQIKHDDDPIRYTQKIPLITGDNLLQTTIDIANRAKELRLPMFIGHGNDDCVTDCNHSKLFYDKCGCSDTNKTIKIYQGKGHLIYEEEPKVYTDTIGWMMKRIE